jgi:hypothetical protein
LENAESGVPAVETDLDKRYEAGKDGNGNDVKRDLSTTVRWYHVAAAKVYTCAQHNIDCDKTDEAIGRPPMPASAWARSIPINYYVAAAE